MDVGDVVTVASDPPRRGVIQSLPSSKGRIRPRALVSIQGDERWFPLDQLTKYEPLEGSAEDK